MDNAQLYVQSNKLQRRDSVTMMKEVLPLMNWQDGETILDVGCGSGDLTRSVLLPSIPTSVDRMVGVDLSDDMINFAAKHFEHNLIQYQQLDIANANNPRQLFPDGFSKIMSFYCLHWIQDQQSCLRNIFDLLEEGGQTLLVFLANNPIFAMYENMSLKPRWTHIMKDASNFIPIYQYKKDAKNYFKNLAEDTGFKIEICETPKMTFPFTNVNQLKNAISAVNPFVNRLKNNDEKNDFLNECLEELVRITPKNENGETIANYTLIVALLTKDSDFNDSMDF